MIAKESKRIPVATFLFEPSADRPVVMTMHEDWLKTGEYILTSSNLEQLQAAADMATFMANSLADEVWELMEEMKRVNPYASDESSIDRQSSDHMS